MLYCNFYDSPIGRIGIFADEDALLGLELNFDAAGIDAKETPLIKKVYEQLGEYFEGKRKTFDLPFAMQGTEYQKKVWGELLKIPYGQTRSYKQVAAGAGNEKAARAVGMANNKNRLPVLIPCHRVIGSDGNLVGFGGGLNIKKKLLELEKRYSE